MMVSRNWQAEVNAFSSASRREKVVLERNVRKDVFIWLMVPGDTVHQGTCDGRSKRCVATLQSQSAMKASYQVHRQTHSCF